MFTHSKYSTLLPWSRRFHQFPLPSNNMTWMKCAESIPLLQLCYRALWVWVWVCVCVCLAVDQSWNYSGEVAQGENDNDHSYSVFNCKKSWLKFVSVKITTNCWRNKMAYMFLVCLFAVYLTTLSVPLKASNGRIVVNNELGRMRKEPIVS
jgi:hypothetical protein